MRVVVIGAGVSGAFAVDTLRSLGGSDLRLDVLERDRRVGGRVFRRRVSGMDVETGASLFHSSNQLIVNSAAQLGLVHVEAGSGGRFGVWDGSRYVFRASGRGQVDTVRLLARYGLPLVRAGREVGRLVRRLEQVYPRLERGESWDTPHQLLSDLDLYELSQDAAKDHFPKSRFVYEFVDGVSRNNYAQAVEDLNALAELVSLAGAGLGGGTLRRVTDGNDAVVSGLLARSGAQLRTSAAAERIEPLRPGWRVSGDGFAPIEADVVVIAAPLESSALELVNVPAPSPRQFVTLHVTFIAGSQRPGALGGAEPPPDFTLSTAAAGSLLSIERVADTAAGPLYKVFSTDEPTDQTIDRLFIAQEVTRVTWRSYPRLPPTSGWPGFRLEPGLYYTGAMEYAVSTMETQAIGGVATANLIGRDNRA